MPVWHYSETRRLLLLEKQQLQLRHLLSGEKVHEIVKVKLNLSGWTPEPSHPSALASGKYYQHSCVSIDDGIITTGGRDDSGYLKSVYFFKNEEWKNVGELSNVKMNILMQKLIFFIQTFRYNSMIAVQGAFLVFGGYEQR